MSLQKNGVTVKIYRSSDGTEFTISWIGPTGRDRETRKDETAAMRRGQEVLTDLVKGRADRANVTADQIAYWKFCEGKLNGVALLDAVNEYIKNHHLVVVQKDLRAAVDEFLQAKEQQGVSAAHLTTIRSHLVNFAKMFPKRFIHDIDDTECNAFIISNYALPRTQRNRRISLVTLYKWAKSKGFVKSDEETAAERTLEPVVNPTDPGILTPDELRSVFLAAEEPIQAGLAIAAFAGVRIAELFRLKWSDINWTERVIILSRDITKTKRRRTVHIHDNLWAWLNFFDPERSRKDFIMPNNGKRFIREAYRISGVENPHNCLRHSYISYRMAITRNAAEVAEQCGNSESQLQEAYKMNVTQSAANDWFSISPTSDAS